MYLLSVWFNLSDEGVEDAIYDSYAFRQFLGIDFWAHEQAPDATTLCKFRKMLTEQGVTEQLFESIKALLEEQADHARRKHRGRDHYRSAQLYEKRGKPARS